MTTENKDLQMVLQIAREQAKLLGSLHQFLLIQQKLLNIVTLRSQKILDETQAFVMKMRAFANEHNLPTSVGAPDVPESDVQPDNGSLEREPGDAA